MRTSLSRVRPGDAASPCGRREVGDLRRLLELRPGPSSETDPDQNTELQYLRNILFEYMMGKEPLVSRGEGPLVSGGRSRW